MERLTTDKMVSKMGMYGLAHNGCYIDNDGKARYRDFDTDIDARELTREIMRGFGLWEIDDEEMVDDETFDITIMENLMYEPKYLEGLIALFYRNLLAMAELRERLKSYEDAEEQGLLLRLPCKVGDTIYVIPSWVNYRLNKSFGHSEKNRVYPQIVHSVQMWSKDAYSLTTCDGLRSEVSDFYKETWFLTKEEAEQALAEMGGE